MTTLREDQRELAKEIISAHYEWNEGWVTLQSKKPHAAAQMCSALYEVVLILAEYQKQCVKLENVCPSRFVAQAHASLARYDQKCETVGQFMCDVNNGKDHQEIILHMWNLSASMWRETYAMKVEIVEWRQTSRVRELNALLDRAMGALE